MIMMDDEVQESDEQQTNTTGWRQVEVAVADSAQVEGLEDTDEQRVDGNPNLLDLMYPL